MQNTPTLTGDSSPQEILEFVRGAESFARKGAANIDTDDGLDDVAKSVVALAHATKALIEKLAKAGLI